jgi:hypothetical protein
VTKKITIARPTKTTIAHTDDNKGTKPGVRPLPPPDPKPKIEIEKK